MTVLRRQGADAVRGGRPWSLPLEDRALLVAAYWRTNLTMRQLAPLFGVSKSAADRIIDRLGPMLVLQPRKRFAKDTVLIVDGTLVPTRDHTIAARSKNYRYSTNHQVVIHADTRLVVVVGRPLAGNRNDCKAWEESGAKAAVGKTMTIADGGYPGTGLVIPHRRERGQAELPDWKEEHNKSHKQVRARGFDLGEGVDLFVTDDDGRGADPVIDAGDARPVLGGRGAAAQVVQADAGFGGQDPHADLLLAHLQAEDR